MDNTTIGNRIGILRREKGLTQDSLAELLDVSPQAVSKWENDQNCPDIGLLPKLAEILDVSVDELLSGKKAPDVKMVPESERKGIDQMVLRMVVDSKNGDKVRINLPLQLVQIALDIGVDLPQINGSESLKNIDLAKIMELVKQGAMGNLLEVESAGDTVRIFVEEI